jgi:AAHS family 4-hydroxybenzoate transporter-like MFS transporter
VANQNIDVAELVENRKLGRYQLGTLALCFLILLVDGLDYSAANVGAPSIIRAFNAEKSAMGLVFGWGNFGILCGSFLFGYIGDRYGRKFGAVAGVLTYALPAIAVAFAGTLEHLMVLRFLAGLGIGGVIPNTVALLTETAPKKYRASFVMLCFVGYSAGTAVIAQVAAWLIPIYGWSVVFITAGIVGTLLGLFLAFALPESLRYLALKHPTSPQLKRQVAKLAPDLQIDDTTRFYVTQRSEKFRIAQLFEGDLKWVTPLLWLGYFAESLTFMTMNSWIAVILETAGLAPQQASLAVSYVAGGGVVALLLLSRFLDRYGPSVTVLTALAAIVLIVALGMSGISTGTVIILAVLGMACCFGTHNSFNGTVGSFYPTVIRAKGVGFASGMGRVALITGPVVAGFLLSAHLPLQKLLYVIAAPYLVVACVCVGLGWLYQKRFAAGESGITSGAATSVDVTQSAPASASR